MSLAKAKVRFVPSVLFFPRHLIDDVMMPLLRAGRLVDAAGQREEAERSVSLGSKRRPHLLCEGERQVPRFEQCSYEHVVMSSTVLVSGTV